MRRHLRALVFALMASTSIVPAAHAEPVTAAIGAAAAFLGSGTFAATVANAAIGIGLSLVGSIFTQNRGAVRGGQSSSQAQRVAAQAQLPQRQGLIQRRRIYGEMVVSGGVFFQKTVADTGASAPNVYVLGAVLGDGEMDSLVNPVINGVDCTVDAFGSPLTTPWDNFSDDFLKVSFRNGASDQAIDPIIADRFPEEDTEFRQRGLATVVIEMLFGSDQDQHSELWGTGGLPDVKWRVRGQKVYDPRDATQIVDDPSTWQWSDNATLCEVDWLRSDMGFSVPHAEINWDSVVASANTDDEWVPTLDGLERRGRINGVVFSNEENDSVLNEMALMNRALIRRAMGRYTVTAERAADPVMTIHQDLLDGGFSFRNERDSRSVNNIINVNFFPKAKNNASGETEYRDNALVTADGQELPGSETMRFADTPAQAQRLGYAKLTQNRIGRFFQGQFDISVLNAPGKPNGQLLEPGDCVRLWFRNYDQMNGLYRVTHLEIAEDFTVGVSLEGVTADVINGWSTALETPYEEAA